MRLTAASTAIPLRAGNASRLKVWGYNGSRMQLRKIALHVLRPKTAPRSSTAQRSTHFTPESAEVSGPKPRRRPH